MSDAVLIVAHGSRRQQANDHLFQIVEETRKKMPGLIVEPAFLELAEPTIAVAVEKLAKQEVKHIKVLPFFLSKGIHWFEDIPEDIDKKIEEDNLKMTYSLLEPIGCDPLINQLIVDIIKR